MPSKQVHTDAQDAFGHALSDAIGGKPAVSGTGWRIARVIDAGGPTFTAVMEKE